jgi:HEAT repeat protein
MAIPRIPRRRRLRTLMIVVAVCAAGLGAERDLVERLIEQLIEQLRDRNARAGSEATLRLGLLGPRAAFAVGPLDSALDDPDRSVRANAMYSLVRLGSARGRRDSCPSWPSRSRRRPSGKSGIIGRPCY